MTPETFSSWWKFICDPSQELWWGLIIGVPLVGLALFGSIRPHSAAQTILPLGSHVLGATQISDQAKPLKDQARLTIAFDNGQASVLQQDGVRSYHWYSVPGVKMDWSTRDVDTEVPGYMLIFLQFNDPTHTDNWRVLVDERSTDDARVMTTTATSAIIRAVGDMNGKTIDIRFSKDRILR